ncbi:DUF551 domain-containing protein [Yersinia enterocolitica]|nr:DUF551 domain-containing protein [Yersinia enterocolitica]
MKELDNFTVERLEELARGHDGEPLRPIMGEIKSLARIALAAKRAEPVDEIAFNMARGIMALVNETNIGGACQLQAKIQCFIEEALTTTPQLNSPEIPDSWKLVPIEPTQNMVDAHISGMQLAGFSRAYRDMLAAAPEPQNQQQNIPENIPQGWIKCSDQMPEDDTLCLGVDECGVIWTMHFDDGEFRADTGDVDDLEISHWMPLPAAPEKENG